MLRNCLFTGFISGVLFFTAPAWALDFQGSASLDLSTLTFSGIPISLTPQVAFQGATVWAGTFGPIIVDPEFPNPNPTVFDRSVTIGLRSDQGETTPGVWPEHALTAAVSTIGTATSLADQAHMAVSTELSGAGFAEASLERSGFIHALAPGTLTVSVHYSVAQFDAPASPQDFFSKSAAQMVLTDHAGHSQALVQELNAAPAGIGTTHFGILTITQPFYLGEVGQLDLRVGIQSMNAKSVPIPDLVWPTVLAMGVLGGWAAWRRRPA